MKKIWMNRLLCGMMILLLILMTACSGEEPDQAQFFAMDTVMSLSVYGDDAVCERVEARAKELEALFSVTEDNSEIARLNKEGSALLSEDTLALVDRSLSLCGELSGSFDITVYPAVREWGFTTGDYTVPQNERLEELSRRIDYRQVTVDGDTVTLPEGVMIDLGAAAKGYLADACGAILEDSGATCAILNLGGTVLLYGKKPDGSLFNVGVADPDDPAAYFGYLSCFEGVVATSGGYERYFEKDGKRYIHILDPKTARPVDNGVLSVSIYTDDGTRADALSTALFVMGVDGAAEYYRAHGDFECIILTADHRLYLSEGVYDAFTLCDGYDYELIRIEKEDSDA